jgi:hypothetical protein
LINFLLRIGSSYTDILENHYRNVAKLKNFKPILAELSPQEKSLSHITPSKVETIPLGKGIRFSSLFKAIRKNSQLARKIFHRYGHLFLIELYLCIDGKRTLAKIRDLLSFEFKPINAIDFMELIKLLEEEKLIVTSFHNGSR